MEKNKHIPLPEEQTNTETLQEQEQDVENMKLFIKQILEKLWIFKWLFEQVKTELKEVKEENKELKKTNETQSEELRRLRQENERLKKEKQTLKTKQKLEPLKQEIEKTTKPKKPLSWILSPSQEKEATKEMKEENTNLKQENKQLKQEDSLETYLNKFPTKVRDYLPEWVKKSIYIWQVEKYYEANDNNESYDFWLNIHHYGWYSLEIDDWWNNTFIKFKEKPNKDQIEFVRENYKKLESTSFSLAPWDIMTYSLFEKTISKKFDWNYFLPNKTELIKSNFKEPKQQIGLYKNWNKTEAIYLEKRTNPFTWDIDYAIEFDNSWAFIDNRETIKTKSFPNYKQIQEAIEKWLSNL